MGIKALTLRQKEFLAMAARGNTHKKIAEECFVSPKTVTSAFTNARSRLEASTTAQVIVLAIAREELGITHDGVCFVPSIPTDIGK